MGLVNVKANIGLRRNNLQEVEFLVDTGSLYTFLPPDLAADLGIVSTTSGQVVLADGRRIEVGLAAAYMRLMDREGGILVGILDRPAPLLGVTSLEILGLKVNPVDETLEHSRPFGPAVL